MGLCLGSVPPPPPPSTGCGNHWPPSTHGGSGWWQPVPRTGVTDQCNAPWSSAQGSAESQWRVSVGRTAGKVTASSVPRSWEQRGRESMSPLGMAEQGLTLCVLHDAGVAVQDMPPCLPLSVQGALWTPSPTGASSQHQLCPLR